MRDANKLYSKLYSDRSEHEDCKRKMEAAEYKCFSLDEEKFRNLVFMHTNDYVWLLNDDLVNRLTPEGESRTLQDVLNRIVTEYDCNSPIEIFKQLSQIEPWFDECFIMSARFDYRLLGELKIRPLTEHEESGSPNGSFYLEDGNHRALVYLIFLHFGEIKEYKPVRATFCKSWAHIFPWAYDPLNIR